MLNTPIAVRLSSLAGRSRTDSRSTAKLICLLYQKLSFFYLGSCAWNPICSRVAIVDAAYDREHMRPSAAGTPTFSGHKIISHRRISTVLHAAAAPAAEATELLRSTRDVASGTIRVDSHATEDGSVRITIDCTQVPDPNNLVLHWGVSASSTKPHEWGAPPESIRPPNTSMFGDGRAVRSPIPGHEPLTVSVPVATVQDKDGPATLVGIIVRSQNGQEEEWLHADDGLGDIEAPLRPPPPPPPADVRAQMLAERVASQEAEQDMNLFARYCMVNDALGEAMSDPDPGSAAVILSWLRLSSSRQLNWCAILLPRPFCMRPGGTQSQQCSQVELLPDTKRPSPSVPLYFTG